MKKMAVLGGIVIVLIAVIKIGSIFIAPSGKEPTEGKTSTEETFQTVPNINSTTKAREPVTIEIENGGGSLAESSENSPIETLPAETADTTDTTKAAAGEGAASSASGGTASLAGGDGAAKATTKATAKAADFTVKAMDSKTMYAVKSVRVRESASTDSAVVGGLTPGMDVKATGETSNGWIQISYDGGTAYVAKSYLSSNKTDVVKETTAAKKTTSGGSSSSKTSKETKAASKETKAAAKETTAAKTTTAAAEETIAPFPG